MGFSRLIRIPKVQLALLLFLMVLPSFVRYPLSFVLKPLAYSLLATIGSDLLFMYLRKRTIVAPYAAMVTGLILSMTVNPLLPWYGIVLISVMASASKYIVQSAHRHVFNPAAAGLVAGAILFPDAVSWWGVSFQDLQLPLLNSAAYLTLLAPCYISGIRLRRFGIIGAFLLVYAALMFVQHQAPPFTTLADPTILFFAMVMVPEPMTSPSALQRQLLYGAFVAAAAVVYFSLPFSRGPLAMRFVPDGLLPFLLLGNLVFF